MRESNLKKLALALPTVLAWGVTLSLLKSFFVQGFGFGRLLALIFTLGIVFFFLQITSLFKEKAYFYVLSLVAPVILAFFLGRGQHFMLAALVMVFGSAALINFRKHLAESINLRIFHVSYKQFTIPALALVLSLSIFFAHSIFTNDENNLNRQVLNASWPYLQRLSPQFSSDQTVDQYVLEQFKKQGINNPTAEMIELGREQLAGQLQTEVKGEEKLSDLGKEFVTERLNQTLNPNNSNNLGLLFIFLLLLIFVPVIRLIHAFMAYLLFEVFKALKIIKVVETQVTAKGVEI
jgi:hypothetical protein